MQLIVLANLALMTLLFMIAIYVRQDEFPKLLLWSALLTYFEFLIVSSFTFALSCAVSSPVLPTIGGLFIYLTGNLTEYLKDVSLRSEETDWVGSVVGEMANGLYYILPNLQKFSIKTEILDLNPGAPLPLATYDQIPNLIAYGLAYAVSGYVIAYWVFRRKEL